MQRAPLAVDEDAHVTEPADARRDHLPDPLAHHHAAERRRKTVVPDDVNAEEALAYGRSIRDWPAFPDSADALRYLKQHYRLVILSNVDNESFAFSNAKLGVTFDAIYTAEDIGSYKPSPRNFTYMLDKIVTLGVEKDQILHTAESLFHDHGPANEFGLKSCWIHRRHAEGGFGATMNPGKLPHYDFRFTSMAALADEHRRLTGGK